MAELQETIIRVPTSVDDIAVLLPPAELRRINFSALEFEPLRRAAIEYIKTYYPNEFNDFVKNNGVIMMTEVVSMQSAIIALRNDILAAEGFLPTAESEEAIENHLELIGQSIRRAVPAVADIEISIGAAAPTDVIVSPGLKFTLRGPDGSPMYYEIFRSPKDFISNIIIPAGKRGIVGFGIEGKFADPVVAVSAGGADQMIDIISTNILDEPIAVEVLTGSTPRAWRRVAVIEKSGPNDEVYEVRFLPDRARIVFGNDKAGKTPLAGQEITIRYRQGGGIRGRIQAGTINETRPIRPQPPASAAIEVLFRNLQPSSGGEDRESLDNAKRRAPRDYAVHGNVASRVDYAQVSSTFSHPVYGSVLKAVATVKTSINVNLVEIFVLASGPNGIPVTPSAGLKQGLTTFIRDINVFTDDVIVSDGAIKPMKVDMDVIVSRNADAATTKEQVNKAVDDYFDVANRDMGQGFDITPFTSTIQSIPGVKKIVLFSPSDDVLPTKNQSESDPARIGFTQLITLGSKNIRFFFEKYESR